MPDKILIACRPDELRALEDLARAHAYDVVAAFDDEPDAMLIGPLGVGTRPVDMLVDQAHDEGLYRVYAHNPRCWELLADHLTFERAAHIHISPVGTLHGRPSHD